MPGNVRLKVMEIAEDKDWERRKVMVKMDRRPCSNIVLSHSHVFPPPPQVPGKTDEAAFRICNWRQLVWWDRPSLPHPGPCHQEWPCLLIHLTSWPCQWDISTPLPRYSEVGKPCRCHTGKQTRWRDKKTQCRLTCHPGSDFRESNNRWFIPHVFKSSIIWKMFSGVIQSPLHKEV